VFEKVFQALFSYRPVVFQQGDFRFDLTTASFVAAGIAALIMGAAIFTYRTVGVNGRPRDRVVLTALRMVALALVVFCLFRPTLIVKAAIPQQNVVAVLMDDSRSMQIGDWDNNQPRAEFLRQQLAANTSPLLKSLSERFLVRTFRFSSTAARVNSVKDLSFGGSQTKIGAALDGVREELAGLPVAGVVLVSDGADTSEASLTFLTRVRVDEVKVDRSFVSRMAESPEATAIVQTIVELARQLRLRVVAEGVETAEQRAVLTRLGCDSAQGYHFFRPMPPEKIVGVLHQLISASGGRIIPFRQEGAS